MPTIEWEAAGFQIHCQIETDGLLHRTVFRVTYDLISAGIEQVKAFYQCWVILFKFKFVPRLRRYTRGRRQQMSDAPSLRTLDGSSLPPIKASERAAHVSAKSPSNISTNPRSHIQSFRTLGQLFKIPPFSDQKSHSTGVRGGP